MLETADEQTVAVTAAAKRVGPADMVRYRTVDGGHGRAQARCILDDMAFAARAAGSAGLPVADLRAAATAVLATPAGRAADQEHAATSSAPATPRKATPPTSTTRATPPTPGTTPTARPAISPEVRKALETAGRVLRVTGGAR